MPRPATGQVIEKASAQGRVFALRFRALGHRQYVRLGTAEDGWSPQRARTELENVLADVRRGIWRAPEPEPAPQVERDPTFHEFASRWFDATKYEWRPKTALDYHWQLSHHLLPFFKDHRLSQITIAEVDRYRQTKVAQAGSARVAADHGKPFIDEYMDKRGRLHRRPRRALSTTSINKTITRLAQILEVAVEYGMIERNPARGRRRRLKPVNSSAIWLDRPEQIEALLDAARKLDRHARLHGGHDHKGAPSHRRALLATLVFAGLRIGELTALRWRDVDLAANRIAVRASKTDAGVRQIDLLPALRDELAAHKAQATNIAPDAFVFATIAGTESKQDNIRKRVLAKSVEAANEQLIGAGEVPLPDGLTPHKLRHTFASILVALGVDPGSVMDQLGHTDPGFTLRIYRHSMRRDAAAKQRLRTLVGVTEHESPAEPTYGAPGAWLDRRAQAA